MRLIALIVSFALIASQADARIFHHKAKAHVVKPHGKASAMATRANPVTTFDNSRNNPRYAALVIDADTGQILYERNAREHRYPASLTKMMTLYLTFDALRSGKLRLDTQLTISKKAASQPKMNMGLRSGAHMQVDTAIRALTVRSANDIAVALAEQVGGSEWNFASMMTAKARQLGMNDTVFHNANGLPDTRQYTSAYDLAILGRALRRDFPQYYTYFSARSFDYAGRSWPGHNHVLDRLPGVDGIKTGFINASGFNLVSSLKTNGVSIVAVVMGGYTGASRDNEMVKLLKTYYTQVAELHQKNGTAYAKNVAPAPVAVASIAPRLAPSVALPPESRPAAAMTAVALPPVSVTPASSAPVPPPVAGASNALPPVNKIDIRIIPDTRPQNDEATMVNASQRSVVPGSASVSPPSTLQYQFAMLNAADRAAPASATSQAGRDWAVQVGAFKSQKQASDAVSTAKGRVPELKDASPAITNEGQPDDQIHRARLANLSRSDAENACRKLNAANAACFPLRVN